MTSDGAILLEMMHRYVYIIFGKVGSSNGSSIFNYNIDLYIVSIIDEHIIVQLFRCSMVRFNSKCWVLVTLSYCVLFQSSFGRSIFKYDVDDFYFSISLEYIILHWCWYSMVKLRTYNDKLVLTFDGAIRLEMTSVNA